MEKQIIEKKSDLIAPKTFRRVVRMRKNHDNPRRNDGKTIGHGQYFIFFIKRSFDHNFISSTDRNHKFKGWRKENRKYRKVS